MEKKTKKKQEEIKTTHVIPPDRQIIYADSAAVGGTRADVKILLGIVEPRFGDISQQEVRYHTVVAMTRDVARGLAQSILTQLENDAKRFPEGLPPNLPLK